jgi:DNA-binding response OmpR family regulator
MKADAMATRLSVLTRALPMRLLIVDDDELELALIADRLVGAGFEVQRALNGEEALAMLSRRWMPVVITDWQMPVMDGIAFTEELRARGVEDTYVIMLTMRESSMDYERGYHAGVDDYLTKKLPDAELFARIHAGFNTLALRRSLQQTRTELQNASRVDAESGASSTSETLHRLQSEIRRAQRYGRLLSLITLGVHPVQAAADSRGGATSASPLLDASASAPAPAVEVSQQQPATLGVGSPVLNAIVQSVQGVLRTHVDWVGRLPTDNGKVAFAVVLPEAGAPDGPAIKERIRRALEVIPAAVFGGQPLAFDFGLASLERGSRDSRLIDAPELVSVAEHCRACSGHTGPEQLNAVQRSVAVGVTIACRHGYAVASHCSFKADPPPVVEDRGDPAIARRPTVRKS